MIPGFGTRNGPSKLWPIFHDLGSNHEIIAAKYIMCSIFEVDEEIVVPLPISQNL